LSLRTLLAAISLKEPVFTGVLHCLAAPANLDGVLKKLEKARSNQLKMMHALGFVMQYRIACAPPGPRKAAWPNTCAAVHACVRKVAGARLYALRPLVLVATSAW